MSRAERRALVEREAPALPVSRQCRLLSVSRSSVYRRPAEISEEDGTIMALIDRQYLARPYYRSRRMAAWRATQGHVVNRKRVRRLMRDDDYGGRSYCLSGECYPATHRCLIEMLPLPRAPGTEFPYVETSFFVVVDPVGLWATRQRRPSVAANPQGNCGPPTL